MPAPSIAAITAALGLGVLATLLLRGYRYYRFIAYGDTLPP